jgi:ubiquinone biosynthesis protein UbiJ
MTSTLQVSNLRALPETVASSFFACEAMSEPDAEIQFAEDVVDAIQAARWRGVDDETLARLLGKIAAQLREGLRSTSW